MGAKTTVQSNEPWKPAQASILKGLDSTNRVFDQNQAGLQDTSAKLKQGFDALSPMAFGNNPLQQQSESALSDTIGGKYLGANPYLSGIMKTTNDGIANTVNGQFEAGGRYGSANHAGILAQRIGEADNQLQYQNYNDERGRQQQAIGMSPGVQQGRYAGVAPLLSLAQGASEIPYTGVNALNNNTRTASNNYGTQTTRTSDPMGFVSGLLGAGASIGSAAITKSDARIKDITGVAGNTPDGLPLVNYTLKADPSNTPQTGVIAQDVARLRPDALGPTAPDGTMSVNYGKLGLPDPTSLAAQFHPEAQGRSDALTAATPAGTPQDSPQIKKPSFGDRLFNPDASTTAGKIGLLGQYLMAADGSPFQSVGKGLIGMRADQVTQSQAKVKLQLEMAQLAQANRTANKPTLTTLGNDLVSTDPNGVSKVAFHGSPKSAELPAGITIDPTGKPIALPGFESNLPDVKAKNASQDASDKQDHQDAFQAAMFAHQDRMEGMREAMRARSDAHVTSRMFGLLAQRQNGGYGENGVDGSPTGGSDGQPVAAVIARGDAAAPRNISSPASQALLKQVMAINPTWSASDFVTKQAARKDFTSGPTSKSVASFNTLLSHAAGLQTAIASLKNGNFGPGNAATNAIAGMFGEGMGGASGRMADVQTHLSGVADEAPRAFTGSAPTVSGIQHWASNFSPNATPDAQSHAFNSLGMMLKGRMTALQQKYKAGMGQQGDVTQLFTPDAIAAYNKMTGGSMPAAANNNAPVRIMGDADYGRLATGTRYTGPDGQVRVKR